jgi:hypothetical protein
MIPPKRRGRVFGWSICRWLHVPHPHDAPIPHPLHLHLQFLTHFCYFQASACHSVPLEVLVNLRADITPTLIKDCIAVLKGAGIVTADVQVTNDVVQRLVWLASVAAATIVPTYRNSLPLLLLPLLHAGMPNAAILSCFERLVRTSPSRQYLCSGYYAAIFCLLLSARLQVWTRLGPFFSTSGSIRAKIACCGRLLLLCVHPSQRVALPRRGPNVRSVTMILSASTTCLAAALK